MNGDGANGYDRRQPHIAGQIHDMGRLAKSLAGAGMSLDDACHALAGLRGMNETEARRLYDAIKREIADLEFADRPSTGARRA